MGASMKKSLLAAAVCLLVPVSLAHAEENGLFSSVRTEAAFAPSGSASAPTRQAPKVPELKVKISSPGELARKMRLAGFDVEEDSENRMVTTKVSRGQWTFPVLVVLSDDNSYLMMAVLLRTADSEDQITKDKLLQLLQANRKYAPVSFGYSAKHKRTELYLVVKNQNVTGQLLGQHVDRLIQIAVETPSLWELTPESQPPKSAPQVAEKPAPSPSLVGKWVAARSAKEAFAVEFKKDSTFALVYVNNGQQTKSTGKFTQQGQTLTLEGSAGFRLTGTVSKQTEKQFHFQPEKAGTNLVFNRAS
jgi:hypothetical protein